MKTRSSQPEYIDLGNYTEEEYRDCLKKLDKIGHFLGGDAATFSAFNRLEHPPESILDVGCGGGHFATKLAQKYPQANVLGIDIATEAIQYAKSQQKEQKNIAFETRHKKELAEPAKSFDVVTTTLVCHHMSDHEIIDFLKRAKNVARKAIIINDLHRHFLATASFAIIAPIFFNNRLIIHDGLLSIRRAFKRKEWENYLDAAGFPPNQYTIKWNWAFRWTITIQIL